MDIQNLYKIYDVLMWTENMPADGEQKVHRMENQESRTERTKFPENMKKTKQREEIFRIISEASQPMSAADIYQCLLKTGEKTSLAISTVYRVLAVFEEKGYVIKSTLMDGDIAYYEWNQGEHKHYAVCLKCHKRIPLKSCPFEHGDIRPIEEDFSITSHKLELYGFCKECRD